MVFWIIEIGIDVGGGLIGKISLFNDWLKIWNGIFFFLLLLGVVGGIKCGYK